MSESASAASTCSRQRSSVAFWEKPDAPRRVRPRPPIAAAAALDLDLRLSIALPTLLRPTATTGTSATRPPPFYRDATTSDRVGVGLTAVYAFKRFADRARYRLRVETAPNRLLI